MRVVCLLCPGMSSYLPMRSVEPQVSEVNRGTPVLMCHGDMDQTVAFHYGRESYDQLRKLGVDTEFITYKGMAHSVGFCHRFAKRCSLGKDQHTKIEKPCTYSQSPRDIKARFVHMCGNYALWAGSMGSMGNTM